MKNDERKVLSERERDWFMLQLREGYARLDVHAVADAIEVWLEVWRALLGMVKDDVPTLTGLSQELGMPGVIPDWFDDLLHVGRWLTVEEDPAIFASFEQALRRFSQRFCQEPVARAVHVACTCADLLRAQGQEESADAAFAMIQASFPDRGQVVARWVDSRLDAAAKVDLGLLRQCERHVVAAMRAPRVDADHHSLGWLLQSLRADIHQAEAFGGEAGCRWPYFEVFSWPAPIALLRHGPDLEDAFFLRWGELMADPCEAEISEISR